MEGGARRRQSAEEEQGLVEEEAEIQGSALLVHPAPAPMGGTRISLAAVGGNRLLCLLRPCSLDGVWVVEHVAKYQGHGPMEVDILEEGEASVASIFRLVSGRFIGWGMDTVTSTVEMQPLTLNDLVGRRS